MLQGYIFKMKVGEPFGDKSSVLWSPLAAKFDSTPIWLNEKTPSNLITACYTEKQFSVANRNSWSIYIDK